MVKKFIILTAALAFLAPTIVLAQAAPTITSISPTSASVGGAAVTLTVNGTNFASGSVVRLNNTNLTTTFVSSTQLTAVIPSSSLAAAGARTITVVNTGGQTSNSVTFTVAALPDTGFGPEEETNFLGLAALASALAGGVLLFSAYRLKWAR